MFNTLFSQAAPVLLADLIQKDQGVIMGPITAFLGMILNFIYELVSKNPAVPALGISIILLTIIARTLMLPLGIKSQKSTTAMQKVQPELNKLKEKYGDSKDPEDQRRFQMETQALYEKHKINPFAGCLPMLLTLPIFFALNSLLRQTYMYIPKIGELYTGLSEAVLKIPNFLEIIKPLAYSKVPNGMAINVTVIEDLSKVLNKFNLQDWETLKNAVSGEVWATIQPIYQNKVAVESFLGINLVEHAGLAWPGILIPILTAGTTLLSSYVTMKTSPSSDPSQKTTQYAMMIGMPVMIFMFTINMSSGVGIYWITSSIYQLVQQYFLNKRYSKKSD